MKDIKKLIDLLNENKEISNIRDLTAIIPFLIGDDVIEVAKTFEPSLTDVQLEDIVSVTMDNAVRLHCVHLLSYKLSNIDSSLENINKNMHSIAESLAGLVIIRGENNGK